MTRDDLDALRETWDFEGKLAGGRDGTGAVPDSFWETYSAMANAQGGRIVLGAREKPDRSFEVAGLGDPERVERDLWNLLQNRQKVSANLLTRQDVQQEVVEGKTLLVIAVPRARRQDRPVHINGDLFGGTFLRVHEGDRRGDREQVRRMVAEAEFDSRDDRILSGFGVGDLASETVQVYRSLFRSTRPDHPWAEQADQGFLAQVGAFRKDRESGEEGLTLAGLLMFGQFQAIRNALPNYFVDYQERLGETGAIEWTDRLFPDGTWSGNLYDFYRKVVQKLKADLRVPFQLGADLYRRDETHVHEAVREALVNTLIHADYEGRRSILVVKRRDGFEFRNPGGLRLSLDEILLGGRSDCRNRTLQHLFLMLGIGEQAGSGFSRILRAWQEQHWQLPVLCEDVAADETTLRLSMASLLAQGVTERLARRFGKDLDDLQPEARLALALALEEGEVSHQRLREVSGKHPRDLTILLQALLRKGLLERDRPGRGCTYHLPDPGPTGTGTGRPATSSERSIEQTRLDFEQSSEQTSSAGEQTPEEVGAGRDTDQPRKRHWAPRVQVEAEILVHCRERFVSLVELATLLQRTPDTVRVHYIRPMLRQRLLEARFPDHPRHPEQAYRAAKGNKTAE